MLNLTAFVKARHRKGVQVGTQRYFKSLDEPKDDPNHDALLSDETVLVENSPDMRRRFRHIAQRIRIISIHGIDKSFRD